MAKLRRKKCNLLQNTLFRTWKLCVKTVYYGSILLFLRGCGADIVVKKIALFVPKLALFAALIDFGQGAKGGVLRNRNAISALCVNHLCAKHASKGCINRPYDLIDVVFGNDQGRR